MIDLTTSLPGISLKNPLMNASGTGGYGQELSNFYSLDILGAFVTKSATVEPRFGNKQNRIADSYSGTLNCIGLENPGVDVVVNEKIPWLCKHTKTNIIASIAGYNEDDYITCIKKFNNIENIAAYEINISCPNVSHGGMSLSSDPTLAFKATKLFKQYAKRPIYLKLTPNVNSVPVIAKACKDAGADALVLANSYQGARFDLDTGKPILSIGVGGYGGPSILPMALKVVYQVKKEVDIPIIGVGGVSDASDVLEFLYAGACAVQVGSMNLKDPYILPKIIKELPFVLEKHHRYCVKECIGESLK